MAAEPAAHLAQQQAHVKVTWPDEYLQHYALDATARTATRLEDSDAVADSVLGVVDADDLVVGGERFRIVEMPCAICGSTQRHSYEACAMLEVERRRATRRRYTEVSELERPVRRRGK